MNTIRNYQKELDKIIESIGAGDKSAPTLFLHSCCAPCSSYVLEYLRKYFQITVFYYNPNISMEKEYRKRVAEQKRLIAAYNEAISEEYASNRSLSLQDEKKQSASGRNGNLQDALMLDRDLQEVQGHNNNISYLINVVEGDYEPECFHEIAKGLGQCPEGGERCFNCYELRLRETAKQAQAGRYDYFATTLTISPLKNTVKLNEIGERLAAEYSVSWLPSDFKKKGGYQRSIALSREYDLYRQDYCGCVYSKEERERQKYQAQKI